MCGLSELLGPSASDSALPTWRWFCFQLARHFSLKTGTKIRSATGSAFFSPLPELLAPADQDVPGIAPGLPLDPLLGVERDDKSDPAPDHSGVNDHFSVDISAHEEKVNVPVLDQGHYGGLRHRSGDRIHLILPTANLFRSRHRSEISFRVYGLAFPQGQRATRLLFADFKSSMP